jgi:hypothetical protein
MLNETARKALIQNKLTMDLQTKLRKAGFVVQDRDAAGRVRVMIRDSWPKQGFTRIIGKSWELVTVHTNDGTYSRYIDMHEDDVTV